ncbi:MAG TPA: TonB family protein, partial [Polyangiaceae bacterium]
MEIEAPALLQTSDPVYPEGAFKQRLEGSVGLRLTIDVEGRVRAADVIEPAGHGFDEAASNAALLLRFVPARRGGRAVAARILYRMVFALPRAAENAAPLPLPLPARPPPSARPPVPPESSAPSVEITVLGAATRSDQLRHSAEAVTVVDTQKAKSQAADLGEVLARTQGVAVRRDAGLGSVSRVSLNGLYDDQIRFFIDGIPLELAGFPSGISNVPVNLVDRIEIYRGVVPIRFGADALGGAMNLVTNDRSSSHASGNYQVGSFATERATLTGRYQDRRTGLFVAPSAFLDVTRNDYDVRVRVPDAQGRLHEVTVPRFHDEYRAAGAFLEGGVVARSWAERLSLRVGYSQYDKDLQSNAVMTVPYGPVTYGERVVTTSARYEQPLSQKVRVDLVAAFA